MSRLFSLIGLLCVSFGAQAAVQLGAPAPDFSLPGADGKTYQLQDLRDKTVVLEWTNHDCPFVRKHYDSGNMQQLQKDYTAQGVVWLSVISSAPGKQGHVDAATAQSLTQERKAAPTAVLLDESGDVGRLYEAKTTPHMYIIDAAGKLVYMGGIDDKNSTQTSDIASAKPYVRLALDELLAGKPISLGLTRPYGCSVKY